MITAAQSQTASSGRVFWFVIFQQYYVRDIKSALKDIVDRTWEYCSIPTFTKLNQKLLDATIEQYAKELKQELYGTFGSSSVRP